MKRIYKFEVRDQSMSWGWFWAGALITYLVALDKYFYMIAHSDKFHRQISGLRVLTHTVK